MVEVLVLKILKCLTLCLLGETKVAMFAQCRLSLLGGLASSEKHVACLPLMDGWLSPTLFLNHTVHVKISDPFMIKSFITPSY